MRLDYSSNNSGGSWWLADKDWFALQAAGWDVEWYENQTNEHNYYSGGRFLDALASHASKKVGSKEEAMEAVEEFERLTGSNANAEGCNCCGRPHNFTLYHEVDCVHYAEEINTQYELVDCPSCSGTGIKDEYISSFNSEPVIVDYKRGF